jgi:hypothetical protein
MYVFSELALKLEPKHKITASGEHFYRSHVTFQNNTAYRIKM